jgi:hypothetical protein
MNITYKITDNAEFEVLSGDLKIGNLVRDENYWRFIITKNANVNDRRHLFFQLLDKDIDKSKRELISKLQDIKNLAQVL